MSAAPGQALAKMEEALQAAEWSMIARQPLAGSRMQGELVTWSKGAQTRYILQERESGGVYVLENTPWPFLPPEFKDALKLCSAMLRPMH